MAPDRSPPSSGGSTGATHAHARLATLKQVRASLQAELDAHMQSGGDASAPGAAKSFFADAYAQHVFAQGGSGACGLPRGHAWRTRVDLMRRRRNAIAAIFVHEPRALDSAAVAPRAAYVAQGVAAAFAAVEQPKRRFIVEALDGAAMAAHAMSTAGSSGSMQQKKKKNRKKKNKKQDGEQEQSPNAAVAAFSALWQQRVASQVPQQDGWFERLALDWFRIGEYDNYAMAARWSHSEMPKTKRKDKDQDKVEDVRGTADAILTLEEQVHAPTVKGIHAHASAKETATGRVKASGREERRILNKRANTSLGVNSKVIAKSGKGKGGGNRKT